MPYHSVSGCCCDEGLFPKGALLNTKKLSLLLFFFTKNRKVLSVFFSLYLKRVRSFSPVEFYFRLFFFCSHEISCHKVAFYMLTNMLHSHTHPSHAYALLFSKGKQ